MAGGLINAKTELQPDGRTVTTTFESAAAAREHRAAIESSARKIEGGWGARANAWLDRAMARADETGSILSHKTLNNLSWLLLFGGAILAWNAWGRLVPTKGLDLLLSMIGVVLLLALKAAAARIHPAHVAKDQNFENMLVAGAVSLLVLQAVVSTSLYASIAVDQETGRADAQTKIDALRLEQSGLQLTIAQKPYATAEAQAKLIEGFKLKQAVNSKGVVLRPSIGELVGSGETYCKGDSYYVKIYCPVLLEMEAQRQTAVAWEKDKARFDAIPAEISALETKRPAQSSAFSFVKKMQLDADWSGILISGLIGFLVDFLMFGTTYLAHRTPPASEDEAEDETGGVTV